MSQTKTPKPAGKPAREYAWHRHPALIATIPVIGALIGSVATVGLGQAGALPASINPAPPAGTVTAIATQTVTSTVTATVTETPTAQPTTIVDSTPPSIGTPPPGTLAITVLMTTYGKIGPNEYRVGSAPTAYAKVNDESGQQLGRGCYPTWVLKRGDAVVHTVRGESCGSGIDLTREDLKVRGLYHVTISVTTDAGPKGSKTLDFKVT